MNSAPLQSRCIRCGNRFVYEPIKDGFVLHDQFCEECWENRLRDQKWLSLSFMKTKLTLGCLLSLAALLTSSTVSAQTNPPVSPCITNLYIQTWGDLLLHAPYFSLGTNSVPGHCTNVNIWTFNSDGRILISDCSNPLGCVGIPINIAANNCGGVQGCELEDQVIGQVIWRCDNSPQGCDPGGTWHSLPIVLPAYTFWVEFYICSAPNCNLYLSCITHSWYCNWMTD